MPTSLALTKKAGSKDGWCDCGAIRTLIHCWWACEMVELFWKTIIPGLRLMRRTKEMPETSCQRGRKQGTTPELGKANRIGENNIKPKKERDE